MPEFQCHLSKIKQLLPPKESNGSRDNSSSRINMDYDQHATFEEIQKDLKYINKACHKLKDSADCVNEEIQRLILQGLDDAFKERTEAPENSPRINKLKRIQIKKVLIHWWVGEEFIDSQNSDGKTAEETGNEYFKDFIKNRIIEPVHKKLRQNSENCKMHPTIRAAIIKLAEENDFVSFDQRGNPTADFKRLFLVKTEEGSSLHNLTYIYHYLRRDKIVTLFNVNEPYLSFRVDSFSKMKNLKVLQLGRWKASAKQLVEVEDTEFLKGLKKMKRLRYFSLRGISGITELPNSICKLSSLRILNLSGCDNLEKLPDGIGSLKQLTHLDMSECYLISHMPKGLTCLSELRVLKGFVIGTQRSRGHYCKLAHLAVLQHLKKLSIHVDKTEDAEQDLLSLPQFGNLRSLSVAWSSIYNATTSTTTNVGLAKIHKILSRGKSTLTTPRPTSHPVDLHKLGLQNFHDSRMPDWLRRLNLKKLKKLYIRGGKLSDLQLPGDQEDHSWAVECLRLKSLSELKMDWPELQQQLFPKLKYAEKEDCPQLSSFPRDDNGEWIWSAEDVKAHATSHATDATVVEGADTIGDKAAGKRPVG
nr:disease resistance RPP13-like protein 4 [Quercus suber]